MAVPVAIGDTQASAEARRAESLPPQSATDYYLVGEYRAARPAGPGLGQLLAGTCAAARSLSVPVGRGRSMGELKEYQSAEAMLTRGPSP